MSVRMPAATLGTVHGALATGERAARELAWLPRQSGKARRTVVRVLPRAAGVATL